MSNPQDLKNLPSLKERLRLVDEINRSNIERANKGYSGTYRCEWFLGMPMDEYQSSHKRLGSKEYKVLVRKK